MGASSSDVNKVIDTTCHLCAKIRDYTEIDNPQDQSEKEVFDDFADEVKELVSPNPGLYNHYRFRNEKLLKCPHCGTYYWYRRWAPGGSEDVMRTYIHESISRLGFLDVHQRLHTAAYESRKRAQEYGGQFLQDHDQAMAGIRDELALLRHRFREIVSEAISCLENKYEYSQQLSETAERFYPLTGHRQVEEARQREEQVAAYNAETLVEYLRFYEDEGLEAGTVGRLTRLSADNNERVRRSIVNGLIQALSWATGQQTLAEQISGSLEEHRPLFPESLELLEACRGYVR